MDIEKLIAGAEVFDRKPPKHELRRTYQGRKILRDMGVVDRNSLDSKSKPFIAWDGEGITHGRDGVTPQSYVLLAASTGDYIQTEGQLTTRECLDFLLKVKFENPHSIMVGFAFAYDTEMILADLKARDLAQLHRGRAKRINLARVIGPTPKGQYQEGEYRIEYIPRKWFQVTGSYKGKKTTCRIWDVWGYFGGTFINALKSFLTVPDDDMNKIAFGKGERGQFTVEQLRSGMMLEYCQLELKYLQELMTYVRKLLDRASMCPSQWHGPPSIADKVFRNHRVQDHMAIPPDEVLDASQFAYFGGRVENFRVGRAWQGVHKWDIRSAYPSAMRECPSLAGRRWKRRTFSSDDHRGKLADLKIRRFGLYRISYRLPNVRQLIDFPNPFPHRDSQGNIKFSIETTGWYWGPEVAEAAAMRDIYPVFRDSLTIHEAWEIDSSDGPLEYPFHEWVQDIYETRRRLKEAGDPLQYPFKISLNSAYGKLAQRAGYDRSQKIPKWHQYEWAGYITSATRAKMFAQAVWAWERGGLVAIETDAIVTLCDMPQLKISSALGDWDHEQLDDLIYLQSGIYFSKFGDDWKIKYRGMDDGTLNYDDTMAYLSQLDMRQKISRELSMTGMERTRFVGSKRALKTAFHHWRCWITEPVELNVMASMKRWHTTMNCKMCDSGKFFASEGLHTLTNWNEPEPQSFASRLPWRTVVNEKEVWDKDDEKEFDET